MLHQQTVEALHTLKCPAMAAALTEQAASPAQQALSFDERLALLVDRELTAREDRRLERYRKLAKLRADAVVEDLDFRHPRGLDRGQVMTLAAAGWVRHHHTIAIVGPTGVGKTFLACALANAAITRGHTALYLRTPRVLDELAIAHVDGRFARLTAAWARIDVLILDDFALRPLTAEQTGDILEIIEDRAGRRSTVITSQLPVADWHQAMGEPTVADAVLDRLLHHCHRIELTGESMRRRDNATDSVTDGDPPVSSLPGAPSSPSRRPQPASRPAP